MLPMPFKQTMLYNQLLIPEEHRKKAQEMSMDIWNDLTRIDSAYPSEEITIEHILKDLGKGLYSIDMRLNCANPKVQEYLDKAYEQHMYLPRLDKPDCLTESNVLSGKERIRIQEQL